MPISPFWGYLGLLSIRTCSVLGLSVSISGQFLMSFCGRPSQFNQVLQGVDLILAAGNPSAVGVDMNAAQGTTIEDVTVYAAADVQSGVAGGNGGGGSYKGLTVIGAKYGIDMRETGDSATYVSITLLNQTCAGALMNSPAHMTATGMRVEGSPALAGVASRHAIHQLLVMDRPVLTDCF
jgi:hypothetical protein